jgi:hypothetical protein
MFIYVLLTNCSDVDPSQGSNHVSVTAFASFEDAAAKLYDWYNGQTGSDGEIYESEWRQDENEGRWFNPQFPESEIRRIYFYTIANASRGEFPSSLSSAPRM